MWAFAWQNLITRPSRTTLAVVGLTIPVLAFLGLFSISQGIRDLMGNTLGKTERIDSECGVKEDSMRRATSVVCLAAALATQGLETRGQPQAQDVSAVVVALATRESAAYVKAFNDRKTKDLTALFTPDADFAFLQGPSVDKLEYGLVRGRREIVDSHETFFSVYPDSRLKQTVFYARLIRPDMLIADIDFELVGLPSNAGPIRGQAVTVRVLESGVWKIAAERNVSRTPVTK
jgi:uncharacterized protein (TIGR02246 family)